MKPFDEVSAPETQTETETQIESESGQEAEKAPWYDPSRPEMTPEEAAAHWANRYKEEQKYIQEKAEALKQYENIDLEKVQENEQLINVIAQNPELMTTVEKFIKGEPSEFPPKPLDYDPEDIFDPSTPTGKWYQQVEDIKEQKRIAQVTEILDKREKEKQEIKQQEIAKQQAMEIRNERLEFINRTNLSLAEKEEFLSFTEKGPEAIGLKGPIKAEHLYEFYKVLKSENNIDSKIINAVNNATPPNVTQVPAAIEGPENEERKFVEGLKSKTQNLLGI